MKGYCISEAEILKTYFFHHPFIHINALPLHKTYSLYDSWKLFLTGYIIGQY